MTAVTKMREPQSGCGVETRHRVWTVVEWNCALEQGEHVRRLVRNGRDFDKASRQARAQDFEAALAQRALRARNAYRNERRRLAKQVAA